MELNILKMANIQKVTLLILLFAFLFFGSSYWNGEAYFLSKNAQKFENPDLVTFYDEDKRSILFYDFSDIPDEFEPELWAENKDSQNFPTPSLNVSIPAYSSKTIDPTLAIINVQSHPEAGDRWVVSFETIGTADLIITPMDQPSIDDLDFVFLTCDGEEETPQILITKHVKGIVKNYFFI